MNHVMGHIELMTLKKIFEKKKMKAMVSTLEEG